MNEILLADEALLISDMFCELDSDPNFLTSRSVDVDVDVAEPPDNVYFVVLGSSVLPPLEN